MRAPRLRRRPADWRSSGPARRGPARTRWCRSPRSPGCASASTTPATCCCRVDEDDVREQVRKLVDEGAQAFVVALANAVINPAPRESASSEIILDEYPTHMLGAIPVVLSHQVTGRKGEYARTMSAIIDAYLHDQMYHGLASLELELRRNGLHQADAAVHNTGGMAQRNSTHALQTIHSGPVAGLEATDYLSGSPTSRNVIATDMGGTSFDIGLVTSDGVKFYDFNPVIDRWLVSDADDPTCTRSVRAAARSPATTACGTRSRSARKAPAPTPARPATAAVAAADHARTPTSCSATSIRTTTRAARSSCSLRRAERAIEEHICEPTGLDLIEAAKAIKRKVDTNMANGDLQGGRASRATTRRTSWCSSYGGGGPLHACGIRRRARHRRRPDPAVQLGVLGARAPATWTSCTSTRRSLYLMLYDANTRRCLDDYEVFNDDVRSSQRRAARTCSARASSPERSSTARRARHALRQPAASDRRSSPFDRLTVAQRRAPAARPCSASIYAHRFGEGSQAPEAGVRINVDPRGRYVEQRALALRARPGRRPPAPPAPHAARNATSRRSTAPLTTPVYDDGRARPTARRSPAPRSSRRRAPTYLVEPGWQLDRCGRDAVTRCSVHQQLGAEGATAMT